MAADKKAASDAGAKIDRVPELEARIEELEAEHKDLMGKYLFGAKVGMASAKKVEDLQAKLFNALDLVADLEAADADVANVVKAIFSVHDSRDELSLAGEATFKRHLLKHAPQYQDLMVPVRRAEAELERQQVVEMTAKGKAKLAAVENARVARSLAKQAADNVRTADAAAQAA